MSIHCKICGSHLGRGLVTISAGVLLLATSRSTLYRRQGDPGYPKIYSDKWGGKSYLKAEEIDAYMASLTAIQDKVHDAEGCEQ